MPGLLRGGRRRCTHRCNRWYRNMQLHFCGGSSAVQWVDRWRDMWHCICSKCNRLVRVEGVLRPGSGLHGSGQPARNGQGRHSAPANAVPSGDAGGDEAARALRCATDAVPLRRLFVLEYSEMNQCVCKSTGCFAQSILTASSAMPPYHPPLGLPISPYYGRCGARVCPRALLTIHRAARSPPNAVSRSVTPGIRPYARCHVNC